MHSETTTCEECSTSFLFQPAMINGRNVFTPKYCDPCVDKLIHEEARNSRNGKTQMCIRNLNESIPPIYRDTDKNRLPFDAVVTVDSWEFNPKGIGMVGTSGAGKSRLGVLLLQRIAKECKWCYFCPATLFAFACADQFSDDIKHRRQAEGLLHLTRWVHVLMLDDLGKNKMTDRAEASLYELLEYRTSHRKPTIWTSNSNAKQLRTMFSADRAEAIMRRLIEFSDIYTF